MHIHFQATEYSTFRTLSSALDNLKHCVRELERLGSCYWCSPLIYESQNTLPGSTTSINKDLYKQVRQYIFQGDFIFTVYAIDFNLLYITAYNTGEIPRKHS